ncbi:MAG: nucleotidyltransferase family protein [Flavitalea sp.]
MIREAIILAGGLGTRLRSAVPDLPKCMAPVAGKPFISYVIDYFAQQGIGRFIFSLGYKHDIIEQYLDQAYPALIYDCSVEEEPLGTGGAIQKACGLALERDTLVLNGDTFFSVSLKGFSDFHQGHKANCSLSLKPMQNSDRYGVVELNADQSVKKFKEKQFYAQSLINGGVYALNREKFLQEHLPLKFSFEKDYLEALFSSRKIYGLSADEYFIDIGIPEDLEKAQWELPDHL